MRKYILCAFFVLLNLLSISFVEASDHANGDMINNQELLVKAEAGDVDTQMKLGELAISGFTDNWQEKDAKYWFRKAAQQGNDQARLKLGRLLIRGNASDVAEAKRWYQLAASKGNLEAKRRLGKIYEEENDDKGIAYLKEVAAEGYIPAMVDLYLTFKNKDYSESTFWVDQIIESIRGEISEGDQILWGLLLVSDIKGLIRDDRLLLVKEHYKNIEAEQYRDVKDLWIYDRFFSIKSTFEVLPDSVFDFFETASKQGDDFATYSLARINNQLSRGNPREQYRVLAERGFLPAMHHYGLMCIDGEGGVKNVEEGFRMLESAAMRGLWDSVASLVHLYGDDTTSFYDEEKVFFWKNYHGGKGIAEAQYRLAQLNKCQNKKQPFRLSARHFRDPSYRFVRPLWVQNEGSGCDSKESYLEWLRLSAEKNHEAALSELVTYYKNDENFQDEYENYLNRFVGTGSKYGSLTGIFYDLSQSGDYENVIKKAGIGLAHIEKFLNGEQLSRDENWMVLQDINKIFDSYIREKDVYKLEVYLRELNNKNKTSFSILRDFFVNIDKYKSKYYEYKTSKALQPKYHVRTVISDFHKYKYKDLKFFELVVNELREMAASDPRASESLALMYLDGINTPVDLTQAEKYFKICSSLDDGGSCDYFLAQMSLDVSEDNYRKYLKRAADKGDRKSREILRSEMHVGYLKNVDVHIEKSLSFFPVIFEKSTGEDLLIRADRDGRIVTSQLSSGRSMRDYVLGKEIVKIYYVGGGRLIYVEPKGLGVLDLVSGEIVRSIAVSEGLTGVDYAYDLERLIVSTEGRVVKLFDSDLNELQTFRGKNGVDINVGALSTDATKYASVSETTVSIRIYDLDENKLLDELHLFPRVNYMKFLDDNRLLLSVNEDSLYEWHDRGMSNRYSGLLIYTIDSKKISYLFPNEKQKDIEVYETGLFFNDNDDQYYSWHGNVFKIVRSNCLFKNNGNIRINKDKLLYFEKNIAYVYEEGLFQYEFKVQKNIENVFLFDEGAMVILEDGVIAHHSLKKESIADTVLYTEISKTYSKGSKIYKNKNSITMLDVSGKYFEYSLTTGKETDSGSLDNIPYADVLHMGGDGCLHYDKTNKTITLQETQGEFKVTATLERDPEKVFSYRSDEFLKYEDGTIDLLTFKKDGGLNFAGLHILNLVPTDFYTAFDYDRVTNTLVVLDTKTSHIYKWLIDDDVQLIESTIVPFGSAYFAETANGIVSYDLFGGSHTNAEDRNNSEYIDIVPPASLINSYLDDGFVYKQDSFSLKKSIENINWKLADELAISSNIGFVDTATISNRKGIAYDSSSVINVMDVNAQTIAVFSTDYNMSKFVLELIVNEQAEDKLIFDLGDAHGYTKARYHEATGLFIVESRKQNDEITDFNLYVYEIDNNNKFVENFNHKINSFSMGITSGGKLIYKKNDGSGVEYVDLNSLSFHDVSLVKGYKNLLLAKSSGYLIAVSYSGELIVFEEKPKGFVVEQEYEARYSSINSSSGYGEALYFDLDVTEWKLVSNTAKHKTIKYQGGQFEEVHAYTGSTSKDLGRYYVTNDWDYKIHIFDKKINKSLEPIDYYKIVSTIAISNNHKYLHVLSKDGSVDIFDLESMDLLLTFYALPSKEWLSLTPEGFFNSSPDGAKHLNVRIGNKVYGIEQFYDALYRPDLVEAKLQGDPMGLVAKATEKINLEKLLAQGSAPRIKFTSHKSGDSSDRDIKPEIEITEKGGGIGKVLWKLNGTTIGVEEPAKGRELEIDESLATSKRLTLSPGENVIEVIAYNKDGGMASDPYTLRLNLKDEISEIPSLHILAVGVNKYRDKSLWLNYAVPDSKDLVTSIKSVSNTIFETIYVDEIYDKDATLADIEQAFVKISKQAKTSDVFVLYLAGHGITLDGRYHFLPVDFRYRNEDSVREKAINQDHLQKWMSQIPARKSLVLLDTCNSGSFVQAQAVTRGGLEEKVAIEKLTRATGRATIAASSDSQVALEGYEGHGVFTYALMKALTDADGNYGNRDGITTTMELANFLDEVVPDITYEKWGYEQVPQVNLHGRQFPIGVTVH